MLISLTELLGRSWKFTTAHWRALAPYMAWLFIPTLVLALAGYGAIMVSGYSAVLNLVILVLLALLIVANYILGLWVSLSLTYTIGHGLGEGVPTPWRVAFGSTRALIWPALFSSLLAGLIFIGGTLLFIVPGIVFAGWYLFVVYEVVFDQKRGLAALRGSKALVAGRWWHVAIRFIVPLMVYGLISVMLQTLFLAILPTPATVFYNQLLNNTVTALINSLIAPFVVAATVELYISAKQTPVPVRPAKSRLNEPA